MWILPLYHLFMPKFQFTSFQSFVRFSNTSLSCRLILPTSQLQAQSLTASQIRWRIPYLMPTYYIFLLLHAQIDSVRTQLYWLLFTRRCTGTAAFSSFFRPPCISVSCQHASAAALHTDPQSPNTAILSSFITPNRRIKENINNRPHTQYDIMHIQWIVWALSTCWWYDPRLLSKRFPSVVLR